jgi:hypothetical protein
MRKIKRGEDKEPITVGAGWLIGGLQLRAPKKSDRDKWHYALNGILLCDTFVGTLAARHWGSSTDSPPNACKECLRIKSVIRGDWRK